MKLKDLKAWLDALPESELEKELIYNSTEYGISGPLGEVDYAHDDLYYTGDEPALLHTKRELRMQGYSAGEINRLDVEIPKGKYYIELNNEYSILQRFSS
ncbi:hypothetical protein AM493_07655 [Flavobacterium akiainvivens]|uniref:Uncharacterized protein n=1 Tax=Flavobacterium akiainvivens TaxID=1202724 RepID=A0A0M8MGS3_9FLAO|nr:hypothetical protein [Flavobacterium akiainvivens]KOS05921.1 hypothetical protein AM493_07655 [Flavobacterium akiainvivens]SFQ53255.1 hypothetical protein SAMN05444144_1079 [Flavobacterium akiainvivens]